jgi:hypothetical protein
VLYVENQMMKAALFVRTLELEYRVWANPES